MVSSDNGINFSVMFSCACDILRNVRSFFFYDMHLISFTECHAVVFIIGKSELLLVTIWSIDLLN